MEGSTPIAPPDEDQAATGPNAPHVNDGGSEEDFFGGEDNPGDELLGTEAKLPEDDVSPPAPAAAPDPATAKAEAPAPAQEPPTPATPPAPAAETPPPAAERTGGPSTRKYKVFQRLALTQEVLEALLVDVKKGSEPNVHTVYLLLGEPTFRTAPEALRDVFKANREALGDEAALAAVSEARWTEDTVRVKPRDDEEIVVGG